MEKKRKEHSRSKPEEALGGKDQDLGSTITRTKTCLVGMDVSGLAFQLCLVGGMHWVISLFL